MIYGGAVKLKFGTPRPINGAAVTLAFGLETLPPPQPWEPGLAAATEVPWGQPEDAGDHLTARWQQVSSVSRLTATPWGRPEEAGAALDLPWGRRPVVEQSISQPWATGQPTSADLNFPWRGIPSVGAGVEARWEHADLVESQLTENPAGRYPGHRSGVGRSGPLPSNQPDATHSAALSGGRVGMGRCGARGHYTGSSFGTGKHRLGRSADLQPGVRDGRSNGWAQRENHPK